MSDDTNRPDRPGLTGPPVDEEAVAVSGSSDELATQVIDDVAPPTTGDAESGPGRGPLLERLEMPVEVRFGELRWTLARLLDLRVGDAVPVGPEGHDTVRLFVQGRPFALGELVVVNGRFGFRVTELLRGGDA